MSRNSWAAIAATVAVVVVIVLGFRMLGSPASQRLAQADVRVVRSLADLAGLISLKWNGPERALPKTLEEFNSSATQNPVTHEPFVYHPKSNSRYELCATFATDNRDSETQGTNGEWAHPKGQHCFELDASRPVPQAPYFY